MPLITDPPEFTVTDLITIDHAIASGTLEVRFQDRTVIYRSMDDLLKARTVILGYLQALSGQPARRQIRIYTGSGF